MIEIPKGKWDEKGTYRQVFLIDQGNRPSVNLCCPSCGGTAGLHDHEIADDGTVNPSVQCPYEGCKFHEYIRLKDWKGRLQK
ncbi:MAG: hypothetical protein KJI72_00120 [Patescibacteria group bacterium]|nr:hypothetical protein [Patescibacteria group bacterium]